MLGVLDVGFMKHWLTIHWEGSGGGGIAPSLVQTGDKTWVTVKSAYNLSCGYHGDGSGLHST